jgi:hypothetical protein
MKKLLKIALLAAALAALLAVSALADTPTFAPDTTSKNYTVTVGSPNTYGATVTDGQQYLLLVLQSDTLVKDTMPAAPTAMPTISVTNIVYIDQTAGSTGVTFANFLPKNATYWNYVYLAGAGNTAPVFLGFLGSPATVEGMTNTATGTVTSNNPANPISITVAAEGNTSSAQIATGSVSAVAGTGSKAEEFSVGSLPDGTYTFTFTKAGHTPLVVKDVVVTGGAYTLPSTLDLTMRCGDVNGDNVIDIQDLNKVISLANYNLATSAAATKLADLNGDQIIDIQDLSIIISQNYNLGEKIVSAS